MNINLKALIGKLDDTARAALEAAAGLCLSRTHYDIEVEHFLLKVLDAHGSDAVRIFRHFGIDTSRFQKELERSLDKLKSGNARTPAISPHVLKMLAEAWTLGSIDFGAQKIRTGFVILALAGNAELARMVRDTSREFAKIEAEALRRDFPRSLPVRRRKSRSQLKRNRRTEVTRRSPPRVARRRISINTRSTSPRTRARAKSIRCWGAISKFAR